MAGTSERTRLYSRPVATTSKNCSRFVVARKKREKKIYIYPPMIFQDLSSLQHPVIVLPGMEYANLCALVTFMYNGEVNIYQEQLPALLAMADTLHIRGLADIAGVRKISKSK